MPWDNVVIQLSEVLCLTLCCFLPSLSASPFVTSWSSQLILPLKLRDPLAPGRNMGLQLVHVHISCVTMFVFLEPKMTLRSSKLWPLWPHARCGIALRTGTAANVGDCLVLFSDPG